MAVPVPTTNLQKFKVSSNQLDGSKFPPKHINTAPKIIAKVPIPKQYTKVILRVLQLFHALFLNTFTIF